MKTKENEYYAVKNLHKMEVHAFLHRHGYIYEPLKLKVPNATFIFVTVAII
jgi:hypothetical protein